MTKVTYRVQVRNEEGENYRHFNVDIKGNDSVEREKELIKNIKQHVIHFRKLTGKIKQRLMPSLYWLGFYLENS